MNDVGLFIVDGQIGLKIENGDIVGDSSLETAVLISLFSDQRCSISELPSGHGFRRGWFGDLFSDFSTDEIGSKLWLLGREKTTLETLAAVETRSIEALQWMIEDGVAKSVEASAEYDELLRIILTVTITKPDEETNKYRLIWDEQELLRT